MGNIKSAGVIGAGVMGAAIAAHLANAGIPVVLMDIVPPEVKGAKDTKKRSAIAEEAIHRLMKSEPPAFMERKAAKLVTPANIEDHLELLGSVDWIIEAVVEDLEAKRTLYRRLEKVRKENSIVSSNTSTLPLSRLLQGLPERFRRHFLITHFFNPPRYMRLLELVTCPETTPETIATVQEFTDYHLGKVAVFCQDRPGFIANRVGAFWLQCAVVEAVDRGLSVEEADAIISRSFCVPKTGVFGLLDLVGLDLMMKIDASLTGNLSKGDAYQRVRRDFPLLRRMIGQGYTGRKGKGGFYRLKTTGVGPIREAIDLLSGEYRPIATVMLDSLEVGKAAGPHALIEHLDKGGQYAWAVLSETLSYAASMVPEVAEDIHFVDRAMQLGYNWRYGPFELIDQLGARYLVERLRKEGRKAPDLLHKAAQAGSFHRVHEGRRQSLAVHGGYVDVLQKEGVLLLSDIKVATSPMAKNPSASLWDVGDGVICLEVHSKMNTVDLEVFAMIRNALEITTKGHKALVIYNEGQHFSAGANLGMALFAANVAAWSIIEDLVCQGQELYKALKYSPFPVVGACSGLAIGGGCEMLLHCDSVQAHAESYIGLVETGIGMVPAWGGCKEMLVRFSNDPRRKEGPIPSVARAFEAIGFARVARSAVEAKEMGFLRACDDITFNRDRLLADAKAKALELTADYRSPEPPMVTLPGPSGKAALALMIQNLRSRGELTSHDAEVADALAEVLTGGPSADPTEPVSEDHILALERAAFMGLVKSEATLARIEHTLETGKPLRN